MKTVPKIIAGCMNWGQWGARFTTQQYLEAINRSIALGVYAFDHADIYGDYTTEEEFGQALALQPGLRKEMILISKCGIQLVSVHRPAHRLKSYNSSAQHIIWSAERSLKNLRTDYLDYLLIHRPDPLMDAEEIASAVDTLKQEGKVLHFGVSNFSASQLALLHSRVAVAVNQVQASIVHLHPFTDGCFDQCQQLGIVPMAWSPVGGGNIFNSHDERSLRILEVAGLLSYKYNLGADQLLLSWLLTHPAGIRPVIGTAKLERIAAAVAAMEVALEREDWFMLWTASTGVVVP